MGKRGKMKPGEVVSAFLLISGFGLCITATALLSCVDGRFKGRCDNCWCETTTELTGVILLMIGTALLGVYGAAAANEDKVTFFFRSRIFKPKDSRQASRSQEPQ